MEPLGKIMLRTEDTRKAKLLLALLPLPKQTANRHANTEG